MSNVNPVFPEKENAALIGNFHHFEVAKIQFRAMNSQGEHFVCCNRFAGESSQLTMGMLPDPTEGVHALCRSRIDNRFEKEVRVGSFNRLASWIKTLNAQPNGQFRLHYLADDG